MKDFKKRMEDQINTVRDMSREKESLRDLNRITTIVIDGERALIGEKNGSVGKNKHLKHYVKKRIIARSDKS